VGLRLRSDTHIERFHHSHYYCSYDYQTRRLGGYSMLCLLIELLSSAPTLPVGTTELTIYSFGIVSALLMLGVGISAIRFVSSLPKIDSLINPTFRHLVRRADKHHAICRRKVNDSIVGLGGWHINHCPSRTSGRTEIS
jgi:hypothetical protein